MRRVAIILLVALLGIVVIKTPKTGVHATIHCFQLEWIQPTLDSAYGLAIFSDAGQWYIVVVNRSHVALHNAFGLKVFDWSYYNYLLNQGFQLNYDNYSMSYPTRFEKNAIVIGSYFYYRVLDGYYKIYADVINVTTAGVSVQRGYAGRTYGSNFDPIPIVGATISYSPKVWIYPAMFVSLGNLSSRVAFVGGMPTGFYGTTLSSEVATYGVGEGGGFYIPTSIACEDIDVNYPGAEIVGLANSSNSIYIIANTVLNISNSVTYGSYYVLANITLPGAQNFGGMIDMVVGDFDVDGTKEIAFDYVGAIRVFALALDASGGSATSKYNISVMGTADRIVAVNYTASQSLEFAYVNATHIVVQALDGAVQAVPYSGEVIADLVPADLNDDSLIDIAVLTSTTMYFLYANTSDSYTLPVQPASSNLVLGDIDLDGKLEALYVSGNKLVCVQTPYHSVANTQLSEPTNDRTYTGFTRDIDGDRLSDSAEVSLGTSPYNPDTDHDGLLDGAEVNTYGTDPLNPDTDGDGYSDGFEVANGMNPLSPDIPSGTTGPSGPYSSVGGEDWTTTLLIAMIVLVGGGIAYMRQARRRRRKR